MKIPLTDRPNYQYWQENGDFWVDEYRLRRESQALYALQEMMIALYFSHSAPAKVLEFGCGIGRHLEYLHKIPGIDVYGYDQSKTMLQGITHWAEPEWTKTHVSFGSPVGALPYADKTFDISFSAEVLIHVNPDDLPLILSELIRVSRWQVLNLEPSPDFVVTPDAHNGCWNHDLAAVYGKLGYTCQLLARGYQVHTPHRVILDENRQIYLWPDILLELMLRTEHAWETGRDKISKNITSLEQQLSEEAEKTKLLSNDITILEQQLRKEEEKSKLLSKRLAELLQELSGSQAFEKEISRLLRSE